MSGAPNAARHTSKWIGRAHSCPASAARATPDAPPTATVRPTGHSVGRPVADIAEPEESERSGGAAHTNGSRGNEGSDERACCGARRHQGASDASVARDVPRSCSAAAATFAGASPRRRADMNDGATAQTGAAAVERCAGGEERALARAIASRSGRGSSTPWQLGLELASRRTSSDSPSAVVGGGGTDALSSTHSRSTSAAAEELCA